MALLNNTYVRVAIVLFAVYVLMQMQKGSTEGMDTVVNVTGEGTEVKVGSEVVAEVPASVPTTVYVNPTGAASGTAVSGTTQQEGVFPHAYTGQSLSSVGPSQLAPSGSSNVPPAPLTAVSEELYAQAPAIGGETMAEASQAFTAQAVDFSEVFDGRSDALEPSELIPKSAPGGLYSDIKPDPAFDDKLLINAYQIGIETSSGKKRPISDPRPLLYIPQVQVSPWNNPTIQVPQTRKSFADL